MSHHQVRQALSLERAFCSPGRADFGLKVVAKFLTLLHKSY